MEKELKDYLDTEGKVDDNVSMASEDSVDNILSDITSKIERLKAVHSANTAKAEELKREQRNLQLKQAETEKELKRAEKVAKKMLKLVA